MERPLMLEVRDAYRLWAAQMRRMAGEAGVPDSYRQALTGLLRRPGMSQKELAAHCGVTTASICQTVKEMRRTGYLDQRADSDDQRCVRLYLTEKGEGCARDIQRRIRRANGHIAQRLTPEGEAELRRLLGRLREIMEEGLPGC